MVYAIREELIDNTTLSSFRQVGKDIGVGSALVMLNPRDGRGRCKKLPIMTYRQRDIHRKAAQEGGFESDDRATKITEIAARLIVQLFWLRTSIVSRFRRGQMLYPESRRLYLNMRAHFTRSCYAIDIDLPKNAAISRRNLVMHDCHEYPLTHQGSFANVNRSLWSCSRSASHDSYGRKVCIHPHTRQSWYTFARPSDGTCVTWRRLIGSIINGWLLYRWTILIAATRGRNWKVTHIAAVCASTPISRGTLRCKFGSKF